MAFSIPDTKKITIQSVVCASVLPGSTVYTDDFKSYIGLSADYIHESVCHSVGKHVGGTAHTFESGLVVCP
uniref:ISXO2-like transposase domain-containing protein n=1 Tax=Candidatus Kentrum eta TaxID=2126337 RepID=A0A450V9R9_9GAMM|nr:MAG: ISXO2-like transposase domain-containing protein [Candidatus Kentron sp. H]VFK01541.1 MAG: ISXO2-like transposase domain-containing protein [Candidatus Kentron sp. H]VFK05066.1 MAG: ISXO2-like transposase domain-containing protein [Candidatus Kentron sp. H]